MNFSQNQRFLQFHYCKPAAFRRLSPPLRQKHLFWNLSMNLKFFISSVKPTIPHSHGALKQSAKGISHFSRRWQSLQNLYSTIAALLNSILEFFPESQKRPELCEHRLEISPCPVLLNSNIAPMEYASIKSPQNGKKLLQNPNNKPFLWSKLKHIVCRYSVACGHTLLLLAYSDVALKSHCSWIPDLSQKIPSLHWNHSWVTLICSNTTSLHFWNRLGIWMQPPLRQKYLLWKFRRNTKILIFTGMPTFTTQ